MPQTSRRIGVSNFRFAVLAALLFAVGSTAFADGATSIDDGWRRTANGWERMSDWQNSPRPPRFSAPSGLVAPSSSWTLHPAALALVQVLAVAAAYGGTWRK